MQTHKKEKVILSGVKGKTRRKVDEQDKYTGLFIFSAYDSITQKGEMFIANL